MHTEKDHLCFCETPQMKLLLMFNKLTKPTKILFILKKKKSMLQTVFDFNGIMRGIKRFF